MKTHFLITDGEPVGGFVTIRGVFHGVTEREASRAIGRRDGHCVVAPGQHILAFCRVGAPIPTHQWRKMRLLETPWNTLWPAIVAAHGYAP